MSRESTMRALLINPWVYDFACYDLFSKPIGLLQIATLLKKVGLEVELVDCMDRSHPGVIAFLGEKSVKSSPYGSGNYYSETVETPDIFKDIPRQYKCYGMPPPVFKEVLKDIQRPDIVLVTSGMTYWYKGVFEVIELLRKKFSAVPILLGGIYTTLCHRHALKHSGADFVFKGGSLQEILNLISKTLNKRLSLDPLPRYLSPAYELYPRLEYVSLRTSSGCPYKCTYCGWHLMNPDFSQREPDEVVSEILRFYDQLRIRNFAFYDDALFHDPKNHIIKILKLLLKNSIAAKFHTPDGLHARFLNKELAVLLKKAGFIQPRLGLETANLSRQRKTGGKVDNRTLTRAVSFLKEAGYRPEEIGVYLMIGLPEQPTEEIRDSILFAHRLKVRVYLEEYSPVPGTPDYENSGLAPDADPLLHNNSAFPLYDPQKVSEFRKLKELNHTLNKACSLS